MSQVRRSFVLNIFHAFLSLHIAAFDHDLGRIGYVGIRCVALNMNIFCNNIDYVLTHKLHSNDTLLE